MHALTEFNTKMTSPELMLNVKQYHTCMSHYELFYIWKNNLLSNTNDSKYVLLWTDFMWLTSVHIIHF